MLRAGWCILGVFVPLGSVLALPPPRSVLEQAAALLHKPGKGGAPSVRWPEAPSSPTPLSDAAGISEEKCSGGGDKSGGVGSGSDHSHKKPKPQKGHTTLTVGGRALTKHAHRCSSVWWGCVTGNDQLKNDQAAKVIKRILDNAVWKNCHGLPHDNVVFEARVAEGYGVRWLLEPQAIDSSPSEPPLFPGSLTSRPYAVSFRGFLEPQDPLGHEKGWKH